MFVFVIVFILFNNFCLVKTKHAKVQNLTDYLPTTTCREKKGQSGSNRTEDFDLVETPLGAPMILVCHYCDEPDDNNPKMWFKQSRVKNGNITEVELGVEDELTQNRVFMTPDHTLVIKEIKRYDGGLYYCRSTQENNTESDFNFLVDVLNCTANITVGKIQDWKGFVNASYGVLNDMFSFSNRSDYLKIRKLGINVEVHSEWLPWGVCDGCRKIRKRIADCRLRFKFLNVLGSIPTSTITSVDNSTISNYYNFGDEEVFLLKSVEMSCFSLDLENLFPNISKDLKQLSLFAITESCYSPCKFQFKSSSLPHYKNTLTLLEGEHFTLTCPESTPESIIIWRKDGLIIEPLSRGENIIVDAFNNLHITSATEDEAANYTCYVNGIRMQEVIVFVQLQSVVESEEFSRHLGYLGFIFLICFLMYISGLVLSWNRRHRFLKVKFPNGEEEKPEALN